MSAFASLTTVQPVSKRDQRRRSASYKSISGKDSRVSIPAVVDVVIPCASVVAATEQRKKISGSLRRSLGNRAGEGQRHFALLVHIPDHQFPSSLVYTRDPSRQRTTIWTTLIPPPMDLTETSVSRPSSQSELYGSGGPSSSHAVDTNFSAAEVTLTGGSSSEIIDRSPQDRLREMLGAIQNTDSGWETTLLGLELGPLLYALDKARKSSSVVQDATYTPQFRPIISCERARERLLLLDRVSRNLAKSYEATPDMQRQKHWDDWKRDVQKACSIDGCSSCDAILERLLHQLRQPMAMATAARGVGGTVGKWKAAARSSIEDTFGTRLEALDDTSKAEIRDFYTQLYRFALTNIYAYEKQPRDTLLSNVRGELTTALYSYRKPVDPAIVLD